MEHPAQRVSALMERYASGDDAVFDQLYDLTASRLYGFCLRLTGDPPAADDLFQETYLRVHRARSTYLPGSDVLHWAFAIARSAYRDRLRYWRRRPEHLGSLDDAAQQAAQQPDEGNTPDAELTADHLAQVVTVELQKMSETNRSAYVLLREEGVSLKEAAAILGASPDAVKQRAHRAYQQLRAALRRAQGTEGSP
ncbi:MAG TPA: sigma-70 family RNA polymerase sigma factor [Pseudomonadales bacterium]